MSVSNSFQTLLERIQPLDSQAQSAASHISSIKSRLTSVYTVKKFVVVGSHSRGTSIRGKSDVDLFVVVSRDDARWGGGYVTSTTMLDRFKKELEGRFWNSTVYKDVHAIVVDFTDCRVDVVPAFFAGTTNDNWPLYSMPDGNGGWMPTSPERHNQYIRKADEASGWKLTRTAQLIKFWRECRNPRIPISSFHIEMILASESICVRVQSYAQFVRDILQSIAARECRAIRDPLGIAGNIACVKTENQRESALASVRYSRDQAKTACSDEEWGNTSEAKRRWDIVFNDKFPW